MASRPERTFCYSILSAGGPSGKKPTPPLPGQKKSPTKVAKGRYTGASFSEVCVYVRTCARDDDIVKRET